MFHFAIVFKIEGQCKVVRQKVAEIAIYVPPDKVNIFDPPSTMYFGGPKSGVTRPNMTF